MDWKGRTWTDKKGREILIHTMSNRWLNNLKKFLDSESIEIKWIKEEIKRRKNKLYYGNKYNL